MTTFAELFGLTDPNRVNLELSPEHDSEMLIDLDGVVPWLERHMVPAGPVGHPFHAVIQGDFGTGKTHVLRYAQKVLAPRHGFHPVYIELGGFGSRSSFFDLHIRVMNVLVDVMEHLLRRVRHIEPWLASQEALSGDMKTAFRTLANTSVPSESIAKVRAWLIGTGPTPSQAQKLGFTGRLFERAGPIELVNLWKALGELERHVEDRILLLLIDEGEAFQRVVHPDAQVAMGSGLRRLFDPDNRSLGLLMGLNIPQVREGVHPMLRHDVQSRLRDKLLQLKPLSDKGRVRSFITELWKKLRRSGSRTDLFTPAALERLSANLPAFRDAITLQQRGMAATLTTQRDLMRVLSFIGERAYSEGRQPPIDIHLLQHWFAFEGV